MGIAEWFPLYVSRRRYEDMQIDEHNTFYVGSVVHPGHEYREHITMRMDNAAGLRLNEMCTALVNVKSRIGESITPSVIVWAVIFGMWHSDRQNHSVKVRHMVVAERIIDRTPSLIGTDEDDELLRQLDNTSMADVR